MNTPCPDSYSFQDLGKRQVIGSFDGGTITSDAGALLLRELEQATGIIRQFANAFTDHRDPDSIEHTVKDLLAQRVYGIALGYEDLNDHDTLRLDPLLAVLVGKKDPTGQDRARQPDRGKALAGKSTLNRLELTSETVDADERYKKISCDTSAVERLFVDLFLQVHDQAPRQIVLDLDATDDPLHGNQEGRFFHGYYKEYCYLPLYIFCGESLLAAKLRTADCEDTEGTVEELKRIIGQIRQTWPGVEIIVRADSGFCRDLTMTWCEANQVDYVFGLKKNERLLKDIEAERRQAHLEFQRTNQPARVFKDFTYRTLNSWSRSRRVIGKAEHLAGGANPRFVVTSLSPQDMDARALYEDLYCARGEMENRIKEQQRYLFADRTSTAKLRSNQLRLWFSSVAYVLMQSLRRLGLAGTEMAKAQCHTIRLKLLKIGARVRVTVRKVWISFAEGFPYERLFAQVFENLRQLRPAPV